MVATGSLLERIKQLIEGEGPLPLAEYIALCLSDAQQGYYTTRTPIGRSGDFVTAPEISQMFGELIGVWCVSMWRAIGSPANFILVEMGPGRGTLMADLLRVAMRHRDFAKALNVCLLEISQPLRSLQKEGLTGHLDRISWISDLGDINELPAIFIGNEFLDALPFHQFVKHHDRWHERMVGLQENALVFLTGNRMCDPAQLPSGHEAQADGAIFETAPAREAVAETIALHIDKYGGAALLIDYGHQKGGFGDTFQAVKGHQYANPLAMPGEADLTSHVDFEALAARVSQQGIDSKTTTQGDFLRSMGLFERAGSLGSGKSAPVQEELQMAVDRLAGAQAMGNLFKVLAIARHGVDIDGFSGPRTAT